MSALNCPRSSRTHSHDPSAVVELVSAATSRAGPFPLPFGQISDVRVKSIFSSSLNVICPVQSSPQKYSASSTPQISDKTTPSRPARGALAIVTNVGRVAVDAAVSGAWWCLQGGLWSVSGHSAQTNGANAPDEPRCEDGQCPAKPLGEDGEAAYGKSVWFWHPLLVSS